ncbi:hypothetical protein DF044_00005 [Burkholderia contaminans]|uniref:hypothetical protein n=1 Tax=Burkholderia contaminans TaxID=488447 RepID=UPI000F5AD4FA|nr:hypothetical protein [Burkholderia contaminans]RQT19090.1 hypothetical protein DF044_00005 [Burkholderia contaminans]
MNHYTYRAYYDGTPTPSDPLRAAKDETEIEYLLKSLPERLEYHLGPAASLEIGEIEMHDVRGYQRLSLCITIYTPADEKLPIHKIELAFKDLNLFGESIR